MHEALPDYYKYPPIVFIGILLVYLAISLALGAKKVYFEPFTEAPDDPEADTKKATVAVGAEPWKVGEKGGAQPSAPAEPEQKGNI